MGCDKVIGRRRAEGVIDVRKMVAVELIEIAVVGGVMFRAVPPVPVAAFGDQDFVKGQLALRLGGAGRILGIKVASMMQVVPGAIVFGSADPDVEVSIDPRARNQRRQARNCAGGRWPRKWSRPPGRSRVANRRRSAAEIRVRTWIIFPGIFAIENHRNHGVAALRQHRLGCFFMLRASVGRHRLDPCRSRQSR